MGNINQRVFNGVLESGGAWSPQWFSNLSLAVATTTNANDSIKITGADGVALASDNVGHVTLMDAAAGTYSSFQITSDVTIDLTGAHWENGTRGDLTDAILRVLAINNNGTLIWGVALLGGRATILSTDMSTTTTNITKAEYVLINTGTPNASNWCRELGWFRANFDDTSGAAEDLWAVQTGVGDLNLGSADGHWQPYNTTEVGFSGTPTYTTLRFTQIGRQIFGEIDMTGTSDTTGFVLSLPTDARLATFGAAGWAQDASSTVTNGTMAWRTTAGTSNLTMTLSAADAGWTNSGTKALITQYNYEVGPAASFIP